MGAHFEGVNSDQTFLPAMFAFMPGRVLAYLRNHICFWDVFPSHSSPYSLVMHSGMFVHEFLIIYNSSRYSFLTNCIQHSSFFSLMGKRMAAWSTGPPPVFVEVSGGLFLHWKRAEENPHPLLLLAQQRGHAWFTAGKRTDGHPP